MKNPPWVTRARHLNAFVCGLISLLLVTVTDAGAQVSVSDSGTASYSQAIAVPPGVGGMAPKLALLYAGGGINGPLGQGWSVQGLSSITRCPATMAVDGKNGNVSYAPSDKLCLDGQRLIQTDATGAPLSFPQSNDALGQSSGSYIEYRTEKDTYARVRAYGYANGDSSGASGPAFFRVWTKAGQIYDYGANPDVNPGANSLIAAPGKAPMAWAVARISDTLGNFVDFKYEQRDVAWGSGPTAGSPLPGHEWNTLEIQYSGNKVIFNYDDQRTDKAEAYQVGNKNVSVRRLSSITTYVNSSPSALGANGGTPVRTTQLTYDYGPITKRSRIKKVQECAGGPTSTRCLPAATFDYSNGGNDGFIVDANFSASALSSLNLMGNGANGVLVGDFNGDGKTDILYWSDTPANNKLYASNGDGTFSQNYSFNITGTNLFKSDGCFISIAADFNGDGITDILRVMRAIATNGTYASCGTLTNTLYLGNASGSFTAVAVPSSINLAQKDKILRGYFNCAIPYSPDYVEGCTEPGEIYLGSAQTQGSNFHLIDVNGDGYLDIVTTIIPAVPVPTVVPFNETSLCSGTTCTRIYLGSANGNFSEFSGSNLANRSVYAATVPGSFFRKPYVADVNGDGLADLFVESGLWLSNGNGSFTFVQSNTDSLGCANSIDFNGDGRADCVNTSVTASEQSLTIGDGTLNSKRAANFNLLAIGQELGNGYSSSTAGIQVLDFNGDGRQDILRWKDNAQQNVLYLSNGDGTFTESTTFNLGPDYGMGAGLYATQLQKSDGTASFYVGDFTGRGSVELLRLQTVGGTTTNRLLTKADPTPADQLIGVTGPTGLKTTLYHVPLSNSTPTNGVSDASLGARYQSDIGNAAYAVPGAVDLSMPMYVVATQVSDSGVGDSKVATEMAYRGLKADRNGRGLLGFREVLRQRPGADGTLLTVGTQYVQVHPYIGVAANTKTYLGKLNATGSSTVLSTTTNTYCDQTNTAAASTSSNCPVMAKVAKPYLYWTQESGQDLGGNALPSATTTNSYNNTGDPTQIVITTSGAVAGVAQTFTKTTTNAYQTDNTSCSDTKICSWVLGRLSQASVANTVPNSLGSFASSAGNAANASATSGSGIQPPSVTGTSFNPTSVAAGSASIFTWSTSNAGSASVSCSGAGANATGSGLSGSISVGTSSQGTATCTVTALNATGISATGSASLTVGSSGVAFTSTLSGTTWTFTNPNSTPQTITSIGLQFSNAGDTSGAYISGGTCAANGSVAAGAKCTVIVTAPPPSCISRNYSVAPLLVTPPGAASVNWVSRTSNVDMCTDE